MWLIVSGLACCILIYCLFDWILRKPRVTGITNKCVFITGCDTGFGNALARRLDDLGVPVFAGCYTKDGAEKLRDDSSERLQTVQVDVTRSESVKAAYEHVRDNLPGGTVLWGVVNNAGILGLGGPIEFLERKDYEQIFQVNFFGMVDVCIQFTPLLKQSQGRIVNTSSMAGFVPFPQNTPYTTSKWAALGFTNCVRLEKKPWGIKTSCIEPGTFGTSILDPDAYLRAKGKQWDNLPEEVRQQYGQQFMDYLNEMIPKMIDEQASHDLDKVVDCYEHALFARYPRAHYTPGSDSKAMAVLAALPGCVMDAAVSYMPYPVPQCLKKH